MRPKGALCLPSVAISESLGRGISQANCLPERYLEWATKHQLWHPGFGMLIYIAISIQTFGTARPPVFTFRWMQEGLEPLRNVAPDFPADRILDQ